LAAPHSSADRSPKTQYNQYKKYQIVVEGWRNITHSYAMVNQFQLLEMCDRPNLEIFHRDVPYLRSHWQPVADLFNPIATQKLQQIPPPPQETVDAILRIAIPYNFQPGNAKKTCVFCTTEAGIVTKSMLSGIGANSIAEALANSDVTIITPSHWSKQGFLRSGVEQNRVVVVPCGVETNLYKPLPEDERNALRQQLGIADNFVFLNIGILSDNKGIRPLLKAFAKVVDKYPQARLILKGAGNLFESTKFLTAAATAVLTEAETAKVESRLAYINQNLSIPEIIRLYQAADIYLSPYLAEGFNMPVLEAAACGLPVICTQGGPTDDFTQPDFALQISSELKPMPIGGETVFLRIPNLDHLVAQMEWAIAHPEFRTHARKYAEEFIGKHFTWNRVVEQLLTVLTGGVIT
jgi:glycosyltransferase involved in cell wall biosynthesis